MSKATASDPLLDQPKLQIYNQNTMKKLFNGAIKYDIDYQVTKDLVDLEEFKTFLVEQFPDLEKTLQVSEEYFARLENMFYHLIHCGERPEDFLNKFMMVIDNRIAKVFEDFDKAILNQKPAEYGKISENFDFAKHRQTLKENIIDISNQLHEDYIEQITPPGHDKKIIRQIEQIIRTWTFLKGEPAIISQYSCLKYGTLLHKVCNAEEIQYGDLVEVNLDQIRYNVQDQQFEKTYPVFMHKKDLVVERLHDILKERDELLPDIEPKNIIKSVINRERRKVFRELYDELMKHCQNFKLKDDLEKDQKAIVEMMNTIKRDFLDLKAQETYIDIITGRINQQHLKDTSIHFANTPFFLKVEKFMFQTFKFADKIKENLEKIIRYKEKEEKYFQEFLGQAVTDSVQTFIKIETDMDQKGHMKGMIQDEFAQLRALIRPSAIKDAIHDENYKHKIESHLNHNTKNVYLKNVLFGLTNDDREKRKIENDLKKKNREREARMQESMDKMNKMMAMDNDHYTKEPVYYPEKENKPYSSKHQQKDYPIPDLERPSETKPGSFAQQIYDKANRRASGQGPEPEKDLGPHNNSGFKGVFKDIFNITTGRSKEEIQKQQQIDLEKEKLKKQQEEIEKEKKKIEAEKLKQEQSLRDKRQKEDKEWEEERERQRRRDEEKERERQKRREQEEREEEDRRRQRQKEIEREEEERRRRKEEREREYEREQQEKERQRKLEKEREEREYEEKQRKLEREREEQKRKDEERRKEKERQDELERQREHERKEKERKQREEDQRKREEEQKRKSIAEAKKKEDPFKIESGGDPFRNDTSKSKGSIKNDPFDMDNEHDIYGGDPHAYLGNDIKKVTSQYGTPSNQQMKHSTSQNKMKQSQQKKSQSPGYGDEYDYEFEEDIDELIVSGNNSQNQRANNIQQHLEKKKYDMDDMEEIASDANDVDDYDLDGGANTNLNVPDVDPLKASSMMRNSFAYMEQDFDMLKQTNDYIKKSKFGKQFKMDLESINNLDSVTMIFEEFVQQQTAYFFDFADGEGLIHLTMKMLQNDQDFDQEYDAYMSAVKEAYIQLTQDINFPPEAHKLYMPFPRDNDFGISLIEKNPLKRTVTVFFCDDMPEDEQVAAIFQTFLENFMSQDFFNCLDVVEDEQNPGQPQAAMYEVQSIKLDDQTIDALNQFPADSYVAYILQVFCLLYEKDQDQYPGGPNLKIDNDTIQRVFYVNQAMKCFYQVIEQESEKLEQFFEDMSNKQKNDKEFEMVTIDGTINESFAEKFLKDLQRVAQNFQNSKTKKYLLGLYKYEIGEGLTFCVYFHATRVKDKQIKLGCIFLRNTQIEEAGYIQHLAETLEHLRDQNIEIQVEDEFPRHYLLSDYNQYSIPLWCHLIKKMKIGPAEALNVMNFSMISYYTVYSGLD